ncbi:putative NADH-flavin reductase [Scopulibacillus daqui]|uniref:NADH-flavin reductase n=1 Tax=Scopulibacillus daqui TaxID=1469162 RepID=A0ABS2Q0W0_9BACL|nr:NAD(P)-dependent oxidoreductase [Scopulibacillus daqui]MBM7645927.1 putative NADH-flavin reductase [Scopulibacillus daqui]
MKIALVGATGTIGQRILQEALRRGHQVTAVVRDPSRVTDQHDNLRVAAGDIFSEESMAQAAAGHDVVISAYGPAAGAEETLTEATRSLVNGVKQSGVRRLLAVGGAGSLEVAPGVKLADTPEFPDFVKPIALAHEKALEIYRHEDDLDWTNLSPAATIESGTRTGKYRTGTEQLVTDKNGESYISAEDFAVAMLDEVENPQFIRQRFTAAY